MTTLATAVLAGTRKNVNLMKVTESFIQLKIFLTMIIVSMVSSIIMARKSSHAFPSALMISLRAAEVTVRIGRFWRFCSG